MNKMRPIHPGEYLRDELAELGLSARSFAALLGVPTNRITQLLAGKRSITADTALRLAIYFGTAPEFWMNLQNAYDLRQTQARGQEDLSHRKTASHLAAPAVGGRNGLPEAVRDPQSKRVPRELETRECGFHGLDTSTCRSKPPHVITSMPCLASSLPQTALIHA